MQKTNVFFSVALLFSLAVVPIIQARTSEKSEERQTNTGKSQYDVGMDGEEWEDEDSGWVKKRSGPLATLLATGIVFGAVKRAQSSQKLNGVSGLLNISPDSLSSTVGLAGACAALSVVGNESMSEALGSWAWRTLLVYAPLAGIVTSKTFKGWINAIPFRYWKSFGQL